MLEWPIAIGDMIGTVFTTMTRKAGSKKTTARGGNLLLILGVAFVVLILLLRMIRFVAHVRGR